MLPIRRQANEEPVCCFSFSSRWKSGEEIQFGKLNGAYHAQTLAKRPSLVLLKTTDIHSLGSRSQEQPISRNAEL
jgi:hypothetical protein